MVVVSPELSTEPEEEDEDEEDGSSDEFTDSIEDDDDKVTARTSPQVKYFCSHLLHLLTVILLDHRLKFLFLIKTWRWHLT